MRLGFKLVGVAALLGGAAFAAVWLMADTKVTEISVVCRSANQLTEPVRWQYTSKVDPTVPQRIPRALDITLHYTGSRPRAVPPITAYFYRDQGAVLRVVSASTARLPAKGAFTYHVDTGGYSLALTGSGRGEPEEMAFFVAVDGSYFGGLLSPPTCGRYADGHIDIGTASKVPDLKGKQPINLGAADWLAISPLPTAVARLQGSAVSTYAYFLGPIALTETKNETDVPDGLARQEAQVGVTSGTPLFTMTGEPTLDAVSGVAKHAGEGG
jgi:hypothetical protein